MNTYRMAVDGVIRLADSAFIPADERNCDYLRYLAWVAQGNQPDPLMSLADARALKLSEIETCCGNAIAAGFSSAALGEPYRYPAKLTDQSNLQASVLESLFPGLEADWTTPFWCQDATGAWAYRPHTAAQIQRVGTDGKDAINACIAHKIQLEEQLAKAKTLAEVEAITWTAP